MSRKEGGDDDGHAVGNRWYCVCVAVSPLSSRLLMRPLSKNTKSRTGAMMKWIKKHKKGIKLATAQRSQIHKYVHVFNV